MFVDARLSSSMGHFERDINVPGGCRTLGRFRGYILLWAIRPFSTSGLEQSVLTSYAIRGLRSEKLTNPAAAGMESSEFSKARGLNDHCTLFHLPAKQDRQTTQN